MGKNLLHLLNLLHHYLNNILLHLEGVGHLDREVEPRRTSLAVIDMDQDALIGHGARLPVSSCADPP